MSKIDFNGPLKVSVIYINPKNPLQESLLAAVRSLLDPGDELVVIPEDAVDEMSDADLAICCRICGPAHFSRLLGEHGIPAMAIEPYLAFHPYHAAFYRDIEKCGGIVLPAYGPDEIKDSIKAVRAFKALKGQKLVVVDPGNDPFRLKKIEEFRAGSLKQLGVEIIPESTDKLKAQALMFDEDQAKRELPRWYETILDGPGEMDEAHMIQLGRLYLAQKEMLTEHDAIGITPYDIKGFLSIPDPEIMPNTTYAILAHDGFLVCEEADIEALTTELLLYAGTGAHPTMSNIYYAYRDQFSSLSHFTENYTTEMELADTLQSFEDNHITAAHFSASGVLPLNMMEEERYTVRKTVPCWRNQSMTVSTPKKGPVILARLSGDCSSIHTVPGDVDSLGTGDQYGWYRGRWFIRIPDTREFADKCLHQHYAIGPQNGNARTYRILTEKLLKLKHIQ